MKKASTKNCYRKAQGANLTNKAHETATINIVKEVKKAMFKETKAA